MLKKFKMLANIFFYFRWKNCCVNIKQLNEIERFCFELYFYFLYQQQKYQKNNF